MCDDTGGIKISWLEAGKGFLALIPPYGVLFGIVWLIDYLFI